jgi:hypothetical protein
MTDNRETPARREGIDPAAGSDEDLAAEHARTGVEPDRRRRDGEPESPRGRSGLESTDRPN